MVDGALSPAGKSAFSTRERCWALGLFTLALSARRALENRR